MPVEQDVQGSDTTMLRKELKFVPTNLKGRNIHFKDFDKNLFLIAQQFL